MDRSPSAPKNPLRFLLPHRHLTPVFGNDWFALRAESFARFFGTPLFLVGQTAVVGAWIVLNVSGIWKFDIYPFILLNLAFSLQAAYAAPLILLAQTRQADRDKVGAIADAQHREEIAVAMEEHQIQAVVQTTELLELLRKNTELTEATRALTERVEKLTAEVHGRLLS